MYTIHNINDEFHGPKMFQILQIKKIFQNFTLDHV